jgi:hypothetical protein
VKNASKALLGVLDPSNVNVALGTLGPSSTTNVCTANGTAGAIGLASPDENIGTWVASPFPGASPVNDYQNADGTINTGSQIVKSINCLNTSGVGTDLGTPIQKAAAYFATYGRPGAQRAVILMTDGEANKPDSTPQPCKYAFDAATQAKAADIDLVTIGFGVENANCVKDLAPSPYVNADVTQLLADMASPIQTVPADDDLGCTDAENQDGDNFFCEPKSGDLSSVFVLAASQLTESSPRLIK